MSSIGTDCCYLYQSSWRRHQMETFSAVLALCAGNSPVTDAFPSQRPVTRSIDAFFYLCPNKRLSAQSLYGDLRRHRTHYDVRVMIFRKWATQPEASIMLIIILIYDSDSKLVWFLALYITHPFPNLKDATVEVWEWQNKRNYKLYNGHDYISK